MIRLHFIQQSPDKTDCNGEPVKGAGPGYPFLLRRPTGSIARNHVTGHNDGPFAAFTKTTRSDANREIEHVFIRKMLLPVRHTAQKRFGTPLAKEYRRRL